MCQIPRRFLPPSLTLVALVITGLGAVEPAANPYVHRLDATGNLRLTLQDEIRHPNFAWPDTLVTYRVVYDPAVTSPDRLIVTDGAGKPVPVQVAAQGPGICSVSFVTDLPSGGRREFTVATLAKEAKALAAPAEARPATVGEGPDGVVLDTGRVRLRLPASRVITDQAAIPGPFQGGDDGQGWMGTSRVEIPGRTVTAVTTTLGERGPLRASAQVAYAFAEGGSYVVTCTATTGCDFLAWDEQMTGIPKEAGAKVTVDWTGFSPTHRRGNERIDQPKTLFFRGEDPHFAGPEGIEDPAKEMYFRLVPAQADSTISTLAVDFTDRMHQRGIGLAVLDAAKWDDGEYALWASNPTLGIRFCHARGLLSWTMPLATGRRNLALALATAGPPAATPALADPEAAVAIANTGRAPERNRISAIANLHGSLSLDQVKEWQLTYDDALPQPKPADLPSQKGKAMADPQGYLAATLDPAGTLLTATGTWVSPVSLRIMSEWVVPGFAKFRDRFTPEERRRLNAVLLFHAYYAAREELSPMRRMLKGHPNFMADWKYPLLAATALFPAHPLAAEWADQYAKLIQLEGTFWVRPSVAAWEARGGRWTESLGIYNWAFLQPTLRADHLGRLFDGRERMADAGMALHGDYLVGVASAPVRLGKDALTPLKDGEPLSIANGFQRIHPMQGAHAGRRAIPTAAKELGEALLRFRPLTAEHLLWLGRRPAGTATGHGEDAAPAGANQGTNPRLTSGKYTGYGVVLRAEVDTPQEVAVFLQQIDKGPNYRWGLANEGGCGDVYYYAGGRSFAGHQGEDTGDRRSTDTENTSNTGVYKDQTFRGIGMNELTEPFYPLESAQFAELTPRQGPGAYAWPEYQGRSLMLVGSDYLLTHDALNNPSRTVWTSLAEQDGTPTLIPLQGEVGFRVRQETSRGKQGDDKSISERFDCYKGGGDRLMLVSHRTDVSGKMRKVDGGAVAEISVGKPVERTDQVICQREVLTIDETRLHFTGRAGAVRQRPGGPTELILFRGRRVGSGGFTLAVDRDDLGISARVQSVDALSGVCFGRTGGELTLTRPENAAANVVFALDGAPLPTTRKGADLVVALPAGLHRWQLTAGPIEPMAPAIRATVALADGVAIRVAPVASATAYRLERSADTGATWISAGESPDGTFTLHGEKAPVKFHVRAIALNGAVAGRPGTDYPVYVTGAPVLPPTGLRLAPDTGRVAATWGTVLGAKEYRLYRQRRSDGPWELAYAGPDTAFNDVQPGLVPPYSDPGLAAAAVLPPAPESIVTYAVSAVDGIGEGPRGTTATTDPSAWTTWQPPVPLKFRRQSAYWLPPYVAEDQVPPQFYPE